MLMLSAVVGLRFDGRRVSVLDAGWRQLAERDVALEIYRELRIRGAVVANSNGARRCNNKDPALEGGCGGMGRAYARRAWRASSKYTSTSCRWLSNRYFYSRLEQPALHASNMREAGNGPTTLKHAVNGARTRRRSRRRAARRRADAAEAARQVRALVPWYKHARRYRLYRRPVARPGPRFGKLLVARRRCLATPISKCPFPSRHNVGCARGDTWPRLSGRPAEGVRGAPAPARGPHVDTDSKHSCAAAVGLAPIASTRAAARERQACLSVLAPAQGQCRVVVLVALARAAQRCGCSAVFSVSAPEQEQAR